MFIPERYEDVTAEWLTEALRSGGVIDDQAVTDFEVHPLGADRSRASSVAKIKVEYYGSGRALPCSIFAKFVSRIRGNRDLFESLGFFRREIELYKNLGDAIPLNVPKLYFGYAAEDSDLAILLLEDVHAVSKPLIPGDDRILTPQEAKLALTELATLHARWWEDQELRNHKWLPIVDGDTGELACQLYGEAWSRLRGILEPVLTTEEEVICTRLSNHLQTLMSTLKDIPLTLGHGDFHTGNLLWDTLGEPETMWVVDWQLPSRAPGVMDVARLLGTAIDRVHLDLVGREYLPSYYQALVREGVSTYSYDRFLVDYSFGLLYALTFNMAALATVDLARDDSAAFVQTIIGNLAAAAVDAGCAELVS